MDEQTQLDETQLGSWQRAPGGCFTEFVPVATETTLRFHRIRDAVLAFGGDEFDAWDAQIEADAARAVRS